MAYERVLDIGVGASNHLGIYEKPHYKVTGIDPRADVVTRARQTMRGECIVGDGETLPFQGSTFDKVYSLMTLEHVHNPPAVLSESYRVLSPGGRLIIDVPHPRYEAVMARITRDYNGGLHEHVFQPAQIQALVEQAGFIITEISPRMWHAAVGFTAQWLHARLKGELAFDHSTGELLGRSTPVDKKQGKLRDLADRLLWYSENRTASPKRYALLSPLRLMNRVYPWATYIEATKPGH